LISPSSFRVSGPVPTVNAVTATCVNSGREGRRWI
jgi:hypothetical protein